MKNIFRLSILSVLCLGVVMSTPAIAGPKVGIFYTTWFDNKELDLNNDGDPHDQCEGNGWTNNPANFDPPRTPATSGPFELPNGQVHSLVTNSCYSSDDQGVSLQHAQVLDDMGVDFVVYDVTNYSKLMDPGVNQIYQSAKQAFIGFKNYPETDMESAFMLSLTCWAKQCHAPSQAEIETFTYNDHVKAHIEDIASLWETVENQDHFFKINGKPVLFFYVNQGNNVVEDGQSSPYFQGPGNLIPTQAQFNPTITVGSTSHTLYDFFEVRFMLYAPNGMDYSAYSNQIWPFSCLEGCKTAEAAYTSLRHKHHSDRRLSRFEYESLQRDNSQPYLMIHQWNAFSSTDEFQGGASTIEPNSLLHTVDGSPNNDPWYFFNGIKKIIHDQKEYEIVAAHSGQCLDLENGANGIFNGDAIVQQDCSSTPTASQTWRVHSVGAGDNRYITSRVADKCLDVIQASTNNGAKVQQYDCFGNANQLWLLDSTGTDEYEIKNVNSGKCLDVEGGPTMMTAGAKVQQYTCFGTANQRWKLRQIVD